MEPESFNNSKKRRRKQESAVWKVYAQFWHDPEDKCYPYIGISSIDVRDTAWERARDKVCSDWQELPDRGFTTNPDEAFEIGIQGTDYNEIVAAKFFLRRHLKSPVTHASLNPQFKTQRENWIKVLESNTNLSSYLGHGCSARSIAEKYPILPDLLDPRPNMWGIRGRHDNSNNKSSKEFTLILSQNVNWSSVAVGSEHQFTIRQNNFSKHFIGELDNLRERDELTDVTLRVGDQTIRAHQVILSASSPLFREIFIKYRNDQQFVNLTGKVKFSDLESIIKFIYKGELTKSQDSLISFLQTARTLKIKGIIGINGCDKEQEQFFIPIISYSVAGVQICVSDEKFVQLQIPHDTEDSNSLDNELEIEMLEDESIEGISSLNLIGWVAEGEDFLIAMNYTGGEVLIHQGFLYQVERKKGDKVYWCCRHSRHLKCHGRAIKTGQNIRITQSHDTCPQMTPKGHENKSPELFQPTKGIEIEKLVKFVINKNGAIGTLDAKCITPSGIEIDCLVDWVSNDHYNVQYVPQEIGFHFLHVYFNGRQISGSPLKVEIQSENKVIQILYPQENHVQDEIIPMKEISIEVGIKPKDQSQNNIESIETPVSRSTEVGKFTCDQCPKSYLHKKGLIAHQKSHEGDKTLCPKCNKKSSSETNLKIHLKTCGQENNLNPKRPKGYSRGKPKRSIHSDSLAKTTGKSFTENKRQRERSAFEEQLENFNFTDASGRTDPIPKIARLK